MNASWTEYCRREPAAAGPLRLIKGTLLAALAEISWTPVHPLAYYPAHCSYLTLPADGRLRAKAEQDREHYLQLARHRWQAIVLFMDRYHLIEAGGSRHPNRLKGKRCPLRGGRRQWDYDWEFCFPGEDHTMYWRRPGERHPIVCITCPYQIRLLDMYHFAREHGFDFEIDTLPSHWSWGTHCVAWCVSGVDWRQTHAQDRFLPESSSWVGRV
jgi:hypothetical protein